jgi:hypothetical protein
MGKTELDKILESYAARLRCLQGGKKRTLKRRRASDEGVSVLHGGRPIGEADANG